MVVRRAGEGGRGDFGGNDAKEGKPSMWRAVAVGCWRQQGVDLVASRAEQGGAKPDPKNSLGDCVLQTLCRRVGKQT